MEFKYFKPLSLTWWSAIVPLVAGLIVATGPIHGVAGVVDTINNVTGNVPAAVLINAGLAGVGVRGAMS